MLQKKNTYSLDTSKRGMKHGQVVGDDKNSRISDVENYALLTVGADNALKEFMGMRSDDMAQKAEMTQRIYRDGYVNMEDMPNDVKNKTALNTLDVYFTAAGVMTDLLTPGLAFRRTEDNKKRKETSAERYN